MKIGIVTVTLYWTHTWQQ